MEISEIILSLEKKLMPYCLNSCNAKCCHIGKLFVTKNFVDRFNLKAIERADGYFDFEIQGGCFLLKNNKCSIYKDRPIMCSRFPFFERNNKLILASSCKAIKNNFFADELKELSEKKILWEIQ